MGRHYIRIIIACFFVKLSAAQVPASVSSADILQKLDRLAVLGSALYFAAHPDDENTKLIAYLASERKVRTAYLSLTRGDGGQNLIGTEQGIELGLIRTQELLQARRIDAGEQYFSSAYDFGFSKTYEETFRFWKKNQVLREAVWLIRKLKPDIIITRFPPDERGGHGHHQASAILAHEAFLAAADPTKFPDQLQEVDVWQAKRLLWNTASFMRMQGESSNQLKIDIGHFNPLLGQSYGEISALSRSQHKSQGFGSASSDGKFIESFEYVAGEKATTDLFDGIDLTWNRVEGGGAIQKDIDHLRASFDDRAPQKSIPDLASVWKKVQQLADGYWKARKTQELEDLLVACGGIRIASLTASARSVAGHAVPFKTEAIARNPNVPIVVQRINGQEINQQLPENEVAIFEGTVDRVEITQPYWLKKPHSLGKFDVAPEYYGYPMSPDLPSVTIDLLIAGVPVSIKQALRYRFVDPVRGEVQEYLEVVPPVSASLSQDVVLIPKGEERTVEITFQRNIPSTNYIQVKLDAASEGWEIRPQVIDLDFPENANTVTKRIQIANVSAQEGDTLAFHSAGHPLKAIREIAYDHIPRQAWFPDLALKLQPISLVNPIKRVGYIMGAGDLIPESLRSLGIQVDLLDAAKLNSTLLAQYDAIIFGVRALNVIPNIGRALPSLYTYARDGGVVLLQYNVNSRLQEENFAPQPFTLSRARVTEEDADVAFTDNSDPALNFPNKITEADFDGWVQERGLYFAEHIDSSYRTPLAMADENEPTHKGSLLIHKMGKGKFVYTGLSFFRQLPAGVPGATRLFVNLLAKEN
ncbi:PIG-L family deacetylase [Sphingobacterium griseoflavum]|uniref:LmbE family protein n=1 Tax=Sphingobacterium griseoflavum TaxID=1474952 RepID=A0ABQ3HV54_9SPHI|nr:PIG-L family deacetylase [Sphingobacterium griseoflavum]GHE29625.1 hypothetical protein GCM10017764_10720 [Sphingobacterium griseoflavum]